MNTPVVIMGTGKNEGIGKGLNEAIQVSKEYGCSHIMTMDQDSIWKDFNNYKKAIEDNHGLDIAIFAPTIANHKGDLIYKCNKEDLYAITSGSVIVLDSLHTIGLFNEKFFIDEVDNDFCIRTVKKGYHIHVFDNFYLYQQFGPNTETKGFSKYKKNYSSFRTYFQVRNRLWMHRMYPHDLNCRYKLRTYFLCIFRRILLIICFEEDKLNKLKSIMKGLVDGLEKSWL